MKPHAVEVINSLSPFFHQDKNRSIELAERLEVAKVAGSDSHHSQTVGDAYTVINSDSRTIEDILEAIKKGRTKVYGKSSIWKYKIRLIRTHVLNRILNQHKNVKSSRNKKVI